MECGKSQESLRYTHVIYIYWSLSQKYLGVDAFTRRSKRLAKLTCIMENTPSGSCALVWEHQQGGDVIIHPGRINKPTWRTCVSIQPYDLNVEHKCHYCEETFISNSDLEWHIRTHKGQKSYICNECMRAFSRKQHLIKHMRTHTGEKPYSCNECMKSFSQKGNLNIHMRSHTGEKPYSCGKCMKSFRVMCLLVRHMRSHTEEEPYSCHECMQSFSDSTALMTHMRDHTGE